MTSLLDTSISERDFQTVQKLIYELAGISIGNTKQVMVQGRLSKRMRKLGITCFHEYIRFVQSPQGVDEVTCFINALTTNKTEFFRESHHFEFLAKTAFPQIERIARETGNRRLRIWCSAASTGEEPYTIAIAIREYFHAAAGWDIKVLASDIDTDVLKSAEEGVFAQDKLDDLPPGFQARYFVRESKQGNTYRAKDCLRELLVFRRLNLHDQPWPIHTTFDIIFCRNVLIYFDNASQQKIVSGFGRFLKRDGYLMLGHSESMCGMSDQFKPMGITVYKKVTDASLDAQPPATDTIGNDRRSVSASTAPIIESRRLPHPRVSEQHTGQSVAPVATENSKHAIIVGEIFVSTQPVWITTLLGSCVSVCLFDDVAGIGGMNHFMLPEPREKGEACNRYGIHSMELLINSLMKRGAQRSRLKAKVFGGCASVRSDINRIGVSNVEFALQFLKTERIPVVAQFTNQGTGMYIEFHTRSHQVFVRLLDRATSESIDRDERLRAASVRQAMDEAAGATLFGGSE